MREGDFLRFDPETTLPSIPASPGWSLPPIRELSMICFRSSAVWCSSRSSGSTPKRRTTPLEIQLSPFVNGVVADANQPSGRGPAAPSGQLGDRQHLRHLLADRDVQRGDEGEGDGEGDPRRGGMRQPAEGRLDQLCQRGLAEESDPDRGHRDSDLTGGDRFVDPVELLDHRLGTRFPSSTACSILPRRVRTKANSAATKKPLIAINSASRTSSRTLIGYAARYFGLGRPRPFGIVNIATRPADPKPGHPLSAILTE